MTAPGRVPRAGFDGIVCLAGVDWWYHNRGHYEFQMMRELSGRVPVLFVNSIGMRVPSPSEGAGMFTRRVSRKLRSLGRGLVRVRDGFTVLSPVAVPAGRAPAVNRLALPAQLRVAARRIGIRSPLVWVAMPSAADAVDGLRPVGVVYQRTDRFEAYTGVDHERILALHRRLAARADLTLFCSSLLFEEDGPGCRNAAFVDHGVDYERFAAAGIGGEDPADAAQVPRPRIGYVGGLDKHTFDPELFVAVASRLPDAGFLLVGPSTLPEGWCTLPNVTQLGQRPYEDVAAYMAACDVLVMPWNRSPWIEACNPVKLKEYLAVGRPVVSTPFAELERYAPLVRVAADADSFAAEIRAALAERDGDRARRARVERETWTAKADDVLARLAAVGIEPA